MIDTSVVVVGGGAIGDVTAAKLTGAVVDRGREYGVPTPLHERVTELIQAAERGERRPSPDALPDLARLA
jgi:ketopantoate reductase